MNGLSIKRIHVAIEQATVALPGERPTPIVKINLDAENPYKSLSENAWKEEILKTTISK